MSIMPWLRLFRLPNLPTAPGDALAGAAVVMAFTGMNVANALAAGAAAFFFYLYGLADNDMVGAKSDAVDAPERPIPAGELSLRGVGFARGLCLFFALLCGALWNLPCWWWLASTALVGCICLYNRVKGNLLMGACRGLSVLAGGIAAINLKAADGNVHGAFAVLAGVAVGWSLYIAAVTKLSEGEEQESEGLGNRRYLLGLAAFAPLAAFAVVPFTGAFAGGGVPWRQLLALPTLGCAWTFANWCAAVAPLWMAHGPQERRRAVGRTVGALLYMQIGFMLLVPSRGLVAVAAGLWLAARLIRRHAASISGS